MMKQSKMLIPTLREMPSDAQVISHALMVRAGYVRQVSAGIYAYMPLANRAIEKFKTIMREEFEKIGAVEMLAPALLTADLWRESGRYETYGEDLYKLKNRDKSDFILGPTHEETFTALVRDAVKSYKQLPLNLYQIQSKYRDEKRPRNGLLRTREFIMKDAYTFDVDEAGLDVAYNKMYDAYCRIMDRLGLEYKIVKADTGAMGGLLSEEYQALSSIGEDVVVGCVGCDYSSNLEITEVVDTMEDSCEEELSMEVVDTPNAKTIEEVAAFFGKKESDFVKTLLYNVDGKVIAFCIPGDRELNETKTLKLLGANEMELASFEQVEQVTHARVGFAGPVGIDCPVYMDRQIKHMKNFIVGANQSDRHIKNVNCKDFTPVEVADLCQVKEGDICPKCGKKLTFQHGIEVGNLFKLGTKYSKSMNLYYTDANNQLQPVWMGSYGIGLERCMAAVADQHHDDFGIKWPIEIAPFRLAIVPVSLKDEEQVKIANDLYEFCKEHKFDVILDDRNERPGVKFKDMELIGIPYRITVGRGVKEGKLEWTDRYTGEKSEIAIEDVYSEIEKVFAV